jgi:hypothetical protein
MLDREIRGNIRAGEELVRVYRAWHELEQQLPEDKRIDVVDMDLAPVGIRFAQNPFNSRGQVMRALRELQGRFSLATPSGEFLSARDISSTTYVAEIERQQQDPDNFRPTPLDQYLQATMAIRPTLVADEAIDIQYEKVVSMFSKLGFPFNRHGWQQFFEASKFSSRTEVERAFEVAESRFLPIISEVTGVQVDTEATKPKFVERDTYWLNWLSYDTQEGFIFLMNVFPTHANRWHKGIEELLIIHEKGGHLTQGHSWKTNIENGLINPGYGITSIPGPEHLYTEGIGDSLPFLIPEIYDVLSPEGKFIIEYEYLKSLVNNNAHIMVNNAGSNIQELVEYSSRYKPDASDEKITKLLNNMQNSPYHRAYLYAYGGGPHSLRAMGNKLTSQKRMQFVRELYFKPMTPHQVRSTAARLAES